jgi:hypothetical protein
MAGSSTINWPPISGTGPFSQPRFVPAQSIHGDQFNLLNPSPLTALPESYHSSHLPEPAQCAGQLHLARALALGLEEARARDDDSRASRA